MKVCAGCSQELPKDKFSKKQWQAKQQRRCKECITDNREVALAEAPNDAAPPVSCADGKGASDEDLFKEPPPREECPICFLPRPFDDGETTYFSCCGKVICCGCIYAVIEADKRRLCPFCRTHMDISNEDYIERLKKRVEGDDAVAIRNLGSYYYYGVYGLRQNYRKANKLFLRAGGLGDATAYCNIGYAYDLGEGVERDTRKAKYYYEIAAVGGDIISRNNLGCLEAQEGNMDRAMKHFIISAAAGHDKSLKAMQQGYLDCHATKDDFEKALRAHKESKDEMKSEQREAAAAARNQN